MLWAAALLSAGGELHSATDFKPERNHPKSAQSQATVQYQSFKSFSLHMDTHAQPRYTNEHYIELKLHKQICFSTHGGQMMSALIIYRSGAKCLNRLSIQATSSS